MPSTVGIQVVDTEGILVADVAAMEDILAVVAEGTLVAATVVTVAMVAAEAVVTIVEAAEGVALTPVKPPMQLLKPSPTTEVVPLSKSIYIYVLENKTCGQLMMVILHMNEVYINRGMTFLQSIHKVMTCS